MSKPPELILNSAGVLQKSDGEWGDDPKNVAATVWQILRESKHIMLHSEQLKRITVAAKDHDYVITGTDQQYHVYRYARE
mmetsp:Transcript_33091/g.92888  ORF Transcript_33091/g.92888 Transcript_33091/m.92888 type:complete len:80 (+) Transcript_33091:61-300(+)